MGQQLNKYHITDDGIVYRVNEDGSFTSVGNIEDIEKKPSPSRSQKVGWWKRNHNWLWVITLVVFMVWCISCLACPGREKYDSINSMFYYESYFNEVLGCCFIVLCIFGISWYLSSKSKIIFKILQMAIIPVALCFAYLTVDYCNYEFLPLCLAYILFAHWIVAQCLSMFRRK